MWTGSGLGTTLEIHKQTTLINMHTVVHRQGNPSPPCSACHTACWHDHGARINGHRHSYTHYYTFNHLQTILLYSLEQALVARVSCTTITRYTRGGGGGCVCTAQLHMPLTRPPPTLMCLQSSTAVLSELGLACGPLGITDKK